MKKIDRKDKRYLYLIIDQYISEEIDEKTFCDEYYYSYNLQIDDSTLTDKEDLLFFELSQVASRFSEFPEDHKLDPKAFSNKEELAEKIFETKILLQKSELLDLIDRHFKSEISTEKLSEYSWDTINFFIENKKILPPYQENEKSFWYAIWQLQHLSDEEHEKDGSLSRALKDIVMYLKNQKKLPKEYEGKRP